MPSGLNFFFSGAIIAATLTLAGCQEVVDFTRRPVEKAAEDRFYVARTPVYVSARVPLGGLTDELADAVPESVVQVKQWIRGAACVQRNGRTRCGSARVTGEVLRDGPVTLGSVEGGVSVDIPLRFELQAAGTGRYAEASEQASGRFKARYVFGLDIDRDWHVRLADTRLDLEGPTTIKVLNGELSLGRSIERSVARRLNRLRGPIAEALASPELREDVAATWRALHYPVLLSEERQLWLRGDPQEIRFAGLREEKGESRLRFAIMTQLRTAIGERPMPLIARRMPELKLEAPALASSRILLPIEVPYKRIVEQLAAKSVGPLSLGRTDDGDIKAEIKEIDVFPSQARLVVEHRLQVESGPNWPGLYGTAHVLTTPIVVGDTRQLVLVDAELAEKTQSPTLYRDGQFLIPLDALKARMESAVSIDLGDVFSQAVERFNEIADLRLDETTRLVGEFTTAKVKSIEPLSNALRLNLEIVGDLSVRANPSAIAAGRGAAVSDGSVE